MVYLRSSGKSRLDLVHPEDREHFVSERKKGFLGGRPFEHEARLLRHDGQFRCFLIRFAPIKDERGDITSWCGIGTDIEDRKRAEEEIRKENIALREEIIKASMFEGLASLKESGPNRSRKHHGPTRRFWRIGSALTIFNVPTLASCAGNFSKTDPMTPEASDECAATFVSTMFLLTVSLQIYLRYQ